MSRGSSDESVARMRAQEARDYAQETYMEGLKREYAAHSRRNDEGGKRRTREIAAELRANGASVPDEPKRVSDGKTTR